MLSQYTKKNMFFSQLTKTALALEFLPGGDFAGVLPAEGGNWVKNAPGKFWMNINFSPCEGKKAKRPRSI